jgi:hypothetical protein
MQRRWMGRAAGIALVLLAGAGIIGWAAGDTPLVILDGSLTIQSAVPWKQFKGNGDQRSHPNAAGTVTKVTVTVNGADQTVTFNREQCVVDVTYAATDVKVSTGQDGSGLTFSPFSAFRKGATANHLAHNNQNAKISHVTVTKAGVKAFDADASGGTKIVISYQ